MSGSARASDLLAAAVTADPDLASLAPVDEGAGRGAAAWPGPRGSRAVEVQGPADAELVRRMAAGDEEALRRLFRRYASQAHALALRVSGSTFLAEEAVQEAFVSAWEYAPAYDASRGSVRSWLLGMAHHRAVDLVRREASQRRRADLAAIEASTAPGDEDPAEVVAAASGAERERVRRALAQLPEEQRRVIELMYYDGLSQSKVADRLSIPLGTVKSRTLLGMRRLREALAGTER